MPLNSSFLSCNFNIISISVNNLVFATILHLEYSLHLGAVLLLQNKLHKSMTSTPQ